MLKVVLLSTSLVLLGSHSFAQMMPTGDDMPRFDRIDTDSSGSISQDELSAVRSMMFEMADLDGDGAISDDELTALQDVMRARVEMRIARTTLMAERLDVNGDGTISKDELDTPRPLFDLLDADADGEIPSEEFSAARERMQALR